MHPDETLNAITAQSSLVLGARDRMLNAAAAADRAMNQLRKVEVVMLPNSGRAERLAALLG